MVALTNGISFMRKERRTLAGAVANGKGRREGVAWALKGNLTFSMSFHGEHSKVLWGMKRACW